jgi:hypothetical protein
VSKPQKFGETLLARFVPGTIARIKKVLSPGEPIAEFVRIAAEHEITRRAKGDVDEPSAS